MKRGFQANGGFSQSSLSIFGNPNAEAFGRRRCLSPSWRVSADGGEFRSRQKYERPLACPGGAKPT
ncbi:MAG: hypothetical protein DRP74_04035 [Candidatus Omnitrophota bacterium]|nr:MAG: hypothetical protein DRP74_04035 [Candidatus Omnitrophota bacterium]